MKKYLAHVYDEVSIIVGIKNGALKVLRFHLLARLA